LAAAACCYPLRNRRAVEAVAVGGSALTLTASLLISYEVLTHGTVDEDLLYMDALSAYVLLLVSMVGLLASIYSITYLGREYNEGELTEQKLRNYYIFFHLFVFTMLLVCVSNNLA
jgi:hydrogenase-4 component F